MGQTRLLALPLVGAILAIGVVSPALAQSGPFTIAFTSLSGSAIAGTATLTSQGGGSTRIDVQLTPASGDHPMHIHEGACASPNPAPWYALTNVQGGTSRTDVSLSLDELTRAPKSILVHQSAQDLDTVVACADIAVPGGAALVAGIQIAAGQAAPGVAVLPTSGAPAVPLRPIVAFALFALGSLGLFYLVYARQPGHSGA